MSCPLRLGRRRSGSGADWPAPVAPNHSPSQLSGQREQAHRRRSGRWLSWWPRPRTALWNRHWRTASALRWIVYSNRMSTSHSCRAHTATPRSFTGTPGWSYLGGSCTVPPAMESLPGPGMRGREHQVRIACTVGGTRADRTALSSVASGSGRRGLVASRSTAHAVDMVRSGEADIALCNDAARRRGGLSWVSSRPGTDMVWMMFERVAEAAPSGNPHGDWLT